MGHPALDMGFWGGLLHPSELAPVSPACSGPGAGWKPTMAACLEAPAQPHRQDQGLALCTLCLAPIRHHGLRSPSCGSRDKWLAQNSSWLLGVQRFFGPAEPWEGAAEPGHCPLPHDVSCLRPQHAVGGKAWRRGSGDICHPLPLHAHTVPCVARTPALLCTPHVHKDPTRVLCGRVWSTPNLCWI